MLTDGVTMPILVDEAGIIIAGHGRLLAAERNGFAQYPVVVARGWTEEQKRSARIRDNQIGLLSGWDRELLKAELTGLQLSGYDLPLLSIPEVQLRAIMGQATEDTEFVTKPPAKPVTRVGDLWIATSEIQ
jgi:ParB-like chromosome segregation protein Spo0J